MHHATLKAAIARYSPLVTDGKTDEEIKAAIAADEKQFSEEDAATIFNVLKEPVAEDVDTYTVTQRFRDISNFDKIYEVGDDASDFDKKRIADLLSKGLIEKTQDDK